MTTKNFRVRNGLTIGGATSGSTSLNNSATGTDISYTLPTAQGASATVLTNDGSGTLSWALPGGGGSTFGNVTIGVDTDNTISTTTGNLVIDSATDLVQINSLLYNSWTGSTPATFTKTSSLTNNGTGVISIQSESTGTPAVGFGPGILANSELANGDIQSVGGIFWIATDMTANNEDFQIQLQATRNGALPDYKVYINSEGDVSADGDLTLNYDQTVANAVINAYSGTTLGTLTWDGANWTASGGVVSPNGAFDNIAIGYLGANDITALNTNGDIVLTPNGTGAVKTTKTVKIDGDLWLNYNSNFANANINAYSSAGGSSTLAWTGSSWIFNEPVGVEGTFTISNPAGTVDINLSAPSSGSTQNYTFPTAAPAVSGYVLSSTTGGTMSWVANPDTNTTYTYTASSTTGGANLNLVGSDATTNTIKLTNGTGVTNTYVSPTEVSINIGQSVATTADPTFNSIQLTAGTIKSSAGVTAITVSNNDATIADFLTVGGDMRVSGNTIYSSTNTAIELSGQNVSTYGDLTIQGGDLTLNGSTSGTFTMSSPAIAGTQAYILPTGYPVASGYVLSSTTGGTMSWVAQSGGGGAGETFNPFLLAGM